MSHLHLGAGLALPLLSGLLLAAHAAAAEPPPALQLVARAEPLQVPAYADLTVPLELRNLSDEVLTVTEPSWELGTVGHRHTATSPELLASDELPVDPVIADDSPDVVTIGPNEAHAVDYWLGHDGPAVLPPGDFVLVIWYECRPIPPWPISPGAAGLRVESPPIHLRVRPPADTEAKAAMRALIAVEPRLAAGSASLELLRADQDVDAYAAALRDVADRFPATAYADRAHYLAAASQLQRRRDPDAWPLLQGLLEPARSYALRDRVAWRLALSLGRHGRTHEAADVLDQAASRRGLARWIQARWRAGVRPAPD